MSWHQTAATGFLARRIGLGLVEGPFCNDLDPLLRFSVDTFESLFGDVVCLDLELVFELGWALQVDAVFVAASLASLASWRRRFLRWSLFSLGFIVFKAS